MTLVPKRRTETEEGSGCRRSQILFGRGRTIARPIGRGRAHKTRPIKYLTRKDLEAAGVGLDTVFETGRFLQFRNEIDSPETRDPLKRAC